MRRLGIVLAVLLATLPSFISAQTVTPKGSTLYVDPASPSGSQTFYVTNSTGSTHWMSLAVDCGSSASCWLDWSGMYVDPGSSSVVVHFSGMTSNTTVYLTAADDDDGTSDVGTVNLTFYSAAPTVTSTDNTVYTSENASTNYAHFHVTNDGTRSSAYTLSAECTGNVTGGAPACTVSSPTSTLSPGASTDAVVYFHTGGFASGNASVKLNAVSVYSELGSKTITVVPLSEKVSVSSDGVPHSVTHGGSSTAYFTVSDIGNSSPVTYSISYHCTGIVTTCPSGSSVQVYSGSPQSIGGAFGVDPSLSGGTGSVVATAYIWDGFNTYTDSASYAVTVPDARIYSASVTPDAQAVTWPVNTSQTASFTVTNTGNVSNTFTATPSCGGQVSNCSITTTPNPFTLAYGASTTVALSYHADSSGTGTAGISVSGGGASDGGSYAVTVPPRPGVSLSTGNSGIAVAREQCVTASLGSGAAYECGDLRLVHILPSVRTLNQNRTPTLIYSSATASPRPIITADVTIPVGTVPDSVVGAVTINSTSYYHTWSGSSWTSGATRRVAISFDASAIATSAYPYTFTATTFTAGLTSVKTASDTLIIVNRADSTYGAGWWVAGWERIYTSLPDTTERLWVGGDGSARVYHKAHDTVYVATTLDRPDSLTWNNGISRYVRWDDHRLQVRFDASGTHRETVNRLGHTTVFASTGAKVDSIGVPTATSAKQWYRFSYTSGKLSSITAPGSRTVNISQTNSKLTSITGPDATSVGFGYADTTNLLISRINRAGDTVSYAYDAAYRLDTLRVAMDSGPALVTRLRSAESQAVLSSTALIPDSVYTLINGPRLDTTVTRIWVNRWGAPARIKDALGHVTTLVRSNSTFPALVTADTAPNGFVTQATYDGHGNISTSTSIGAYGGTTARTTHYYWNGAWDEPDSVVTPRGIVTRFSYNSSNGNRIYEQTGSSDHRVTYGYNLLNLVDSVTTPASDTPMRVAYDAILGNAIQTISPMGVKDTILTDAIGRDTLSYVVGDSLNKRTRTHFDVMSRPDTVTISGDGGHRPTWILGVGTELPADTVRITTVYDAEGRVEDVTRTRGQATGYTDSQYNYDAAGRVKSAFEAVKTTHYTYDPAGNVISKNDGEHIVTMKYDALNRIVNKFVPLVTYSSTSCMTSPLLTANFTGLCFFNIPDRVTLGNAYGAAACFSSDTATYSYDVAGNLVQADNGDARVRRGYYPNGQIQWDTLRTRQTYRGTADECGGVEPAPPPVDSLGICGDEAHGWRPCNITMSKYALPKEHELALGRVPQQQAWASWSSVNISAVDSSIHGPYVGDEGSGDGDDLGRIFDARSFARAMASSRMLSMAPDSEYSHIYGLSYTYNDDGQRSTLLHPTGYNVPSLCYTGPCTESYTYSTETGDLTGITDIHSLSYTLHYDDAGRVYQLTSPGGVTDTKHFDDDGNVTSVVVVSDIGLLSDSVTYDNMGRVRTGHFAGGVSTNPTEDVTMMYHGLGSVIGMETNTSGNVATEAFTVDALGNRLNSWRLPMSYNNADPNTARIMELNSNGQLLVVTSPKNGDAYATYPYFYRQELGYDGVGNLSTVFTKEQGAFGSGGPITMNMPGSMPGSMPGVTPFFTGSMSQFAFDGSMNADLDGSVNRMMGPTDISSNPSPSSSFYTDSISQTAEAHFYDGDNKLRLFNRHNGIDVNSVSGSNWLYEEYRYDALGRRVWRRTQGGQSQAYVSRTVWDGDQYLYETISNSNTMPGLEYDSAMVGYVNADGLDTPVGVWRGTSSGTVGTMTPHMDWRGAYALGTWDDGSSNPCVGSIPKCSYIAWPAVGMSAARGHPLDVTLPSGYWMGSLLSEATDGSGMQYKRNRYYDPGSGRFTQVDPIGLAGGLNAYGFGGGDQVNFSDPFGLCPPGLTIQECMELVQGMENLGTWVSKTANSAQESLAALGRSWTAQRQAFWRQASKASDAALKWNEENLSRMQRGRAPRLPDSKGDLKSVELSHEPVAQRDGGTEVVPRTPEQHAAVDPFRQLAPGRVVEPVEVPEVPIPEIIPQ